MFDGNRAFPWLSSACCALLLMFTPAAFAQMQQTSPNYTATAYQQLRTLSQQLETVAARTRDEAKLDEKNHGSGSFTGKLDDFVRDAHVFRLLMHENNVPSKKVNEAIRHLMDDGRKVQEESAKAKWHDPQTDNDWRATLGVLDQINTEFMVANGLKAPDAIGTTGRARNWNNDGRVMLADLARRTDDALRISQVSYPTLTSPLQGLKDDISAFNQQFDETRRPAAGSRLSQLLSDAKAIQAQANAQDAPPQLRDDVNSIVGNLVQMRDMAANDDYDRALGTSGTERGGIAIDRNYATMDLSQMTSDLNRRMNRVSDLVSQSSDLGDISSRISDFNNKVSDFSSKSASMSREDRREAIDSLLRDAQRTQRDLAKNNASSSLVNQWNGVVDLLARMRNAV